MKYAYYNDIDPFACEWLRELIKAGLIMDGEVDCRSIEDVQSEDLSGFVRHHFFCGIAGWDLALQIASWPKERPVATCSLPCQPWSCAGKQKGKNDERHLWPTFRRILEKRRFPTIFGEQVPGAIKLGWLDGVFDALETEGYTCGAVVLPACGVNAPHLRQRLWWVANRRLESDSPCIGRRGRGDGDNTGQGGTLQIERLRNDGRVADISTNLCFWQNSIWHPCSDGKARRIPAIESDFQSVVARISDRMGDLWNDGIAQALTGFPLSGKVPNRVGLLKGAGNSIVPQVAAVFIRATIGD
jgi:DNA (cytosine-5)-methyltransferase 1